jgi:hypothetical protein
MATSTIVIGLIALLTLHLALTPTHAISPTQTYTDATTFTISLRTKMADDDHAGVGVSEEDS